MGRTPADSAAIIRSRLCGKSGPAFWRSLDELSRTAEFQAFLGAEFPSLAPAAADIDRRSLLKVMGASLALAGLSGGSSEADERALPYVAVAGVRRARQSQVLCYRRDHGGLCPACHRQDPCGAAGEARRQSRAPRHEGRHRPVPPGGPARPVRSRALAGPAPARPPGELGRLRRRDGGASKGTRRTGRGGFPPSHRNGDVAHARAPDRCPFGALAVGSLACFGARQRGRSGRDHPTRLRAPAPAAPHAG